MFSMTFQQRDCIGGCEPTSKADVVGSEKPNHVSPWVSVKVSLACPKMR